MGLVTDRNTWWKIEKCLKTDSTEVDVLLPWLKLRIIYYLNYGERISWLLFDREYLYLQTILTLHKV